MSEVKPVAYLNEYLDHSTNITRNKPEDKSVILSSNVLVSSNPLYTKEQLQPKVQMTQDEFDELEKSLINAQFDYSELKKTIEIVPNKKWFVKRKNKKQFLFTKGDKLNYVSGKDSAKHFDTKEQAEEWCNPLTEAVLLPVEGE